jgi:hypothetical protein
VNWLWCICYFQTSFSKKLIEQASQYPSEWNSHLSRLLNGFDGRKHRISKCNQWWVVLNFDQQVSQLHLWSFKYVCCFRFDRLVQDFSESADQQANWSPHQQQSWKNSWFHQIKWHFLNLLMRTDIDFISNFLTSSIGNINSKEINRRSEVNVWGHLFGKRCPTYTMCSKQINRAKTAEVVEGNSCLVSSESKDDDGWLVDSIPEPKIRVVGWGIGDFRNK